VTHSASEPYRIDRLERDIAEIKATMMAIQASMSSLQLGLADKFTPRTETVIVQADMTRRTDELAKRIDTWDARFWAVTAMVIGTLVTAVVGLLRTIPPPGH